MTASVGHASNDIPPPLHLPAYLARIGYEGNLDPTLETLRSLHFAHASTIPFENLDILLGRGISLDLSDIQAKLVTARRGGYCFEQNALFAAVLESLGFKLRRLAARVQFGATEIRPRTHMLLEVEIDNEPWLADVGFGSSGLRYPIALLRGEPDQHGVWSYRVKSEGERLTLQSQEPAGWLDLYMFTREPQYAVDYVVGNHYTATHPHSPFVQNLIVQKGGFELAVESAQRRVDRSDPRWFDGGCIRRGRRPARSAGPSLRPGVSPGNALSPGRAMS